MVVEIVHQPSADSLGLAAVRKPPMPFLSPLAVEARLDVHDDVPAAVRVPSLQVRTRLWMWPRISPALEPVEQPRNGDS